MKNINILKQHTLAKFNNNINNNKNMITTPNFVTRNRFLNFVNGRGKEEEISS